MRPFLAAFLLIFAAASFTACSHYRLGTEAPLAFTRLYIAPVENAAGLPQATAIFSTQLREAFLRDSRVVLVNDAAAADATLTVSLARLARAVATATRPFALDHAATGQLLRHHQRRRVGCAAQTRLEAAPGDDP